jgi:hypothetical protein
MDGVSSMQFERIVDEFVQWRAVPDEERSPAPAWWWGPAFEVHGVSQTMPAGWCSSLGLPENSSLAAGAEMFLGLFAEQIFLPWPDQFPRLPKPPQDCLVEPDQPAGSNAS